MNDIYILCVTGETNTGLKMKLIKRILKNTEAASQDVLHLHRGTYLVLYNPHFCYLSVSFLKIPTTLTQHNSFIMVFRIHEFLHLCLFGIRMSL